MRRHLLPLIAAASIFLPLAGVLAWTVPTAWQAPLHVEAAGREGVPLELGFPPAAGGPRTGGMPFSTTDPAWLRRVDTIALLVATYDTTAPLLAARLDALDGSCEFRAEAGGLIPNNGLLILTRTNCNPSASTRDFMLWVRTGETGRVAVWTYPSAGDPADRLVVGAPDAPARFAVRGEIRSTGANLTVRRVDLVAHLWQRDAATIWFWLLLFFGLAVAGAVALRAGPVPVGAALLALSVAGAWAVVVPPLQGADEPDHLLSFGEVTAAPQVEQQLTWLARRTHFERLRFHGDQQFRASDIDRPYDPAWTGDIHAERMDQRSAVAVLVWRMVARLGVNELPLPDLLLAVRAADAVTFALVVGLAAWLVWWAADGRVGLWSMLGLALLPTLPYFATMVSDWAFVASWSVLFAAGLIVLQHDGPRAAWSGLAMGIGVALLFGTSIAAFTLAPAVAVIFVARMLIGHRQPAIFWGGIGVGAVVAVLVTRRLFEAGFARYDAAPGSSSAALLERVNTVAALVAGEPWLLFVPIAIFALMEIGWRSVVAKADATRLYQAGRVLVAAVAAWATLVLAASVVVSWPKVALLDAGVYTRLREYVAAVLASAATVTRLTGFDDLVFTSFFSGFGWVDAILPGAMLGAFSCVCVAALWLSVRGANRQVAWLVAAGVGVAASLVAAAAAGYLMRRNIHGRYVLTAGITGVAMLMAAPGRLLAAGSDRARIAALIAVALLHGLSLAFVATRYF